MARPAPGIVALVLVLVLLALVPPVARSMDEPFYVTLFSRVLILAIGACSLNLVLGYGGMVSFGHAAYTGLGAYMVGIGFYHAANDGMDWMLNGWLHLAASVVVPGLAALVIGAISLRTRGVYFIMITLAFSQMLYYVFIGLERYGGDDGLSLWYLSDFGGLMDLNDDSQLYYLALAVLVAVLVLVHRLTGSRFGMVLRGAKSNERRLKAVGFPTYRYRLVAFAISGAICGLSGFLMANQSEFVSTAEMHWIHSGDLIVMVVLGGMGTLGGPVFGALAFLMLEQYLPQLIAGGCNAFGGANCGQAGEYWKIVFGPLLIMVVLFGRGGIEGLLRGRVSGHG
ncbi:MAG: branched-chain amino acid ABC transporter permease [Pseudomonadota bacterium]|nr:branched-chain amino acid ABC transporter permease [Pseudomonadota bacterium]